ncbi:hypothetical protein ACFSUR_08550 [Halalkalibacter alkalisediminis]|uniref:Uncharacterized protein n=1 Tax=Halalkalibacter alkalisediminis TaxID=935616 RepID=A0ABV6NLS0_9BACI
MTQSQEFYIPAITAIVFGIYVQSKFDMNDGTNLLAEIGSLFGGLFLIGLAELMRLLSKISLQIEETSKN